jgi:hypothetical protein
VEGDSLAELVGGPHHGRKPKFSGLVGGYLQQPGLAYAWLALD